MKSIKDSREYFVANYLSSQQLIRTSKQKLLHRDRCMSGYGIAFM